MGWKGRKGRIGRGRSNWAVFQPFPLASTYFHLVPWFLEYFFLFLRWRGSVAGMDPVDLVDGRGRKGTEGPRSKVDSEAPLPSVAGGNAGPGDPAYSGNLRGGEVLVANCACLRLIWKYFSRLSARRKHPPLYLSAECPKSKAGKSTRGLDALQGLRRGICRVPSDNVA